MEPGRRRSPTRIAVEAGYAASCPQEMHMRLALLLFAACTSDDDLPLLDEGEEEYDEPGRPDTGQQPPIDTGDPGTEDSGDTGETDPPPSDEPQVCYPGPGDSWNVCLSLVDHQSSWGSDYAYPDPYGGSLQYSEPLRFVDLYQYDEDLAISDNFVLSEVMSWWKGQYGVFQSHVVEHIQYLREASGGSITVNSGYRSPAYNASVGGVTNSRHMYGDAADMVPSAISLDELASLCYAEGAGYVGMYTSFVHCDWRDDPLDPAFYDATGGAEGPPRPVHTAAIERAADGLLSAPATGFDEGEPYRAWQAFDAQGQLLERVIGRSYRPPAGAARVEVEVGGQVRAQLVL